jgi:adenylate kinase
LGVEARRYMDAGKLVPDEVTINMVRERLAEPDAGEGFLLDGFPRTSTQVQTLDAILAEHGHELEAVLELTVDDEAVVQRLLKRAEIEGRADDTEEVIRERQAIYRRETAPLTDVYSQRGLLVQVDGMGSVDDVFTRICEALEGVARS